MGNINQIIVDIPPEYHSYLIKAFLCGCCESLALVTELSREDNKAVIWNSNGCTDLISYISIRKRGDAAEAFCRLLSVLCRLCEGVNEASDYLVSFSDINLNAGCSYFDVESSHVKLLPGRTGGNFSDALAELADEAFAAVPECNGNLISEKIRSRYHSCNPGIKELHRFFSLWENELRNGRGVHAIM